MSAFTQKRIISMVEEMTDEEQDALLGMLEMAAKTAHRDRPNLIPVDGHGPEEATSEATEIEQ